MVQHQQGQQAAAQQAARCFLKLLRDVQSPQERLLSSNNVPSAAGAISYGRHAWCTQKVGPYGHISFELEDVQDPPCRNGSERVALLSGRKNFISSSSAGLPQHSVSAGPAPAWRCAPWGLIIDDGQAASIRTG